MTLGSLYITPSSQVLISSPTFPQNQQTRLPTLGMSSKPEGTMLIDQAGRIQVCVPVELWHQAHRSRAVTLCQRPQMEWVLQFSHGSWLGLYKSLGPLDWCQTFVIYTYIYIQMMPRFRLRFGLGSHGQMQDPTQCGWNALRPLGWRLLGGANGPGLSNGTESIRTIESEGSRVSGRVTNETNEIQDYPTIPWLADANINPVIQRETMPWIGGYFTNFWMR